jgi:interferon gamma-inducible protein 30
MQNEHYGLIYCYEFLAIDGKNKMWMNCANKLGLPKKPLMNCFNRGNGTEVIFYFILFFISWTPWLFKMT